MEDVARRAPFDPTVLRFGSDLRRLGTEPQREDAWHCVRRGVWVPAQLWAGLTATQRYQALVHATVLSCREPHDLVLAGRSAAAMLGLPSLDAWPWHVTVLDAERVMGPSRYIRPRHGPPTATIVAAGLQVTTAARTVIDLACTTSLDTALAAADHALRERLATHDELSAEAALLQPGARGRVAARLVVDLADGLSGSAGESLSRLQMFRSNLPRPQLQREYRDHEGLIGYVDFDLPGLIGEFDGKIKYRVPPGASAQDASEIVWQEKIREDRLRRHKPVARWVWSTARQQGALARQLLSHGVKPEPRSTWIDLGGRPRPSSASSRCASAGSGAVAPPGALTPGLDGRDADGSG